MHHWVEPWRKYNFTIVFLTRTAIMLGLSLFMTYVEYYFARVQNVANFVATTALIAVLALGGGVVSGILSGVLSDRMKRRAPVVCVATLFMSATSFAFVVAPGNLGFWLWPLGVLFGLGYGAFFKRGLGFDDRCVAIAKRGGETPGLMECLQHSTGYYRPFAWRFHHQHCERAWTNRTGISPGLRLCNVFSYLSGDRHPVCARTP